QHKFAITTDAWTSCTNLEFLAITLHWIDETWTMKRILLDMIPLHERHTGNYITEKIVETISFYNIGSRIVSATTDNASNMELFGCVFREKLRSEHGNRDFKHVCCALMY
ncbi:7113_t:CDS:1, partial [Gigaspora rosea]